MFVRALLVVPWACARARHLTYLWRHFGYLCSACALLIFVIWFTHTHTNTGEMNKYTEALKKNWNEEKKWTNQVISYTQKLPINFHRHSSPFVHFVFFSFHFLCFCSNCIKKSIAKQFKNEAMPHRFLFCRFLSSQFCPLRPFGCFFSCFLLLFYYVIVMYKHYT